MLSVSICLILIDSQVLAAAFWHAQQPSSSGATDGLQKCVSWAQQGSIGPKLGSTPKWQGNDGSCSKLSAGVPP